MIRRSVFAALVTLGVAMSASSNLDAFDRTRAVDAAPVRIGHFDLNSQAFQSLLAGDIIACDVPTRNRKEIAGCAVLATDVEPAVIAAGLRQLSFFSQNGGTVVGLFDATPRVSDLANLDLDSSDLRALATCRLYDSD